MVIKKKQKEVVKQETHLTVAEVIRLLRKVKPETPTNIAGFAVGNRRIPYTYRVEEFLKFLEAGENHIDALKRFRKNGRDTNA